MEKLGCSPLAIDGAHGHPLRRRQADAEKDEHAESAAKGRRLIRSLLRGTRAVTEKPLDLVVTEVLDTDRAIELLRKLRISPPQGRTAALKSLPAVFQQAVTWMAIGDLAADNESAFKWRIQTDSD